LSSKLPVLNVPESQEVCFVPKTVGDFLAKYLKAKPGPIVEKVHTGASKIINRRVLGQHNGLHFYTIGQRKGIKISGGPWYALGKDVKNKEDLSSVASEDLFLFLKERFGRLEGVVITGGEPTLHSDLPDFIRKIKKIGYLVKLDTNGTNPEMLEQLIKAKLVDYLAMDIKSDALNYEKAVGVKVDFKKLESREDWRKFHP